MTRVEATRERGLCRLVTWVTQRSRDTRLRAGGFPRRPARVEAQLFGDGLDGDFVLSNVTLSWLTGTGGSAARPYDEDAHANQPTEPTTIATAVAAFGGDFSRIRRFADRDHRHVVRWRTFDHGGHIAAHKATDLLAEDIRAFFGPPR
jgi:hypothetical protein